MTFMPRTTTSPVSPVASGRLAASTTLISTPAMALPQVVVTRSGGSCALDMVTVPQVSLAIVSDGGLAGSFDLAIERSLGTNDRYRIGVTLSEADDTLRSHLKLAASEGLVVTEVVNDSPAAKMGVKLHDVLTEVQDLFTFLLLAVHFHRLRPTLFWQGVEAARAEAELNAQ